MYHSVRKKIFSLCVCLFWVFSCSGEVRKTEEEGSGIWLVISEFFTPQEGVDDNGVPKSAILPLLQTSTFRTLQHVLEGCTHNFMGTSHAEMTATGLGVVAGSVLANSSATVVNEVIHSFTLTVEPYAGKDSWVIKLIPDGNLLVAPPMFLLYYKWHNRNFDFFAMDEWNRIGLYNGNAALELSYMQFEQAANKGLEYFVGESYPFFGATATSLVSAIAIGLLAVKAKVDIPVKKFNEISVLSTALAVGHTVAYSGKSFRLGVKSVLVSQGVSEKTASQLGGLATVGLFTSNVVLLTCWGSSLPAGLGNYQEKIMGDMTKNIGLIFSFDLMQPVVQQASDAVHATLDEFDKMLMTPEILHRMLHAFIDPAMIFAAHQVVTKAIGSKAGHIRIYDLIIGYTMGGFLGMFENSYKIMTDPTWFEHVCVWSLAVLAVGIQNSRSKIKVD